MTAQPFWRDGPRLLRALGVVVGLCYVLLTWVPWQPTFPVFSLEGSWVLALHRAFLLHTDFGRRFVFTFGPWGFLFAGFHPRTYGLTVTGWTLLGVAGFSGLLVLARRLPNRAAATVWMVTVLGLLGISSPETADLRMFTLCWLLLFLHFGSTPQSPWPRPQGQRFTSALLAIAVAGVMLVKFSFFIPGLFAVIVVSLGPLRCRQLPVVGIVSVVAHVLFWLLARQPLTSYGPYLVHSLEIVRGYPQGEAVALEGEGVEVLRFVSVAAVWTLLAISANRRSPRGAVVMGVTCLLAFTLSLKTGYVRHDPHEIFATTSLAVLMLLMLPAVWAGLGQCTRCIALLVCGAALVLASMSYSRWRQASLPRMLWTTLSVSPGRLAAAARWMSDHSDLAGRFRYIWSAAPDNLRALHLPPTLPDTIDAFGFSQWVLMESGANYDPRPILQSYLAYTPRLSQLNADFLRSPDAPQTLLMQAVAIDGHYPSMEDSLSWVPLLANYQLREPGDPDLPVVPLLRRARPLAARLRLFQRIEMTLSRSTTVPSFGSPIWARLDLRLTTKGTLLQAAFKAPMLNLVVRTADGVRRSFRIIPENARGGFLLSPAVLDDATFVALSRSPSSGPSAMRVTDIAVVPDPIGWVDGCYAEPFEVEFDALKLEPS